GQGLFRGEDDFLRHGAAKKDELRVGRVLAADAISAPAGCAAGGEHFADQLPLVAAVEQMRGDRGAAAAIEFFEEGAFGNRGSAAWRVRQLCERLDKIRIRIIACDDPDDAL